MEEDSASEFIENIVKNIQMLCHGHVPFIKNVEVIGHLYLNIDSNTKVNYMIDEKCCKMNSTTTFISNSFHASPNQRSLVAKNAVSSFSVDLQNISRKQKGTTPIKADETPQKKAKNSESIPISTTSATTFEEPLDECASVMEDQDGLEITFESESPDNTFSIHTSIKEEIIDQPCDMSDDNITTVASLEDINILESPPDPAKDDIIKNEIEYTIIEFGTQQGKPLLVDNIGYSYNIRQNRKSNVVTWRCTKRNKRLKCAALVTQRGENFMTGSRPHQHEATPGLLTSSLIYAEVRNQAASDFVTPTSQVVERAMSVKGSEEDESFLPKQVNLKRLINRYRQQKRGMFLNESKNMSALKEEGSDNS